MPSRQNSKPSLITPQDGGELDRVAKRIAAEEARPVGDSDRRPRLEPGLDQPLAHRFDIVDLQAEMPPRSILQRLLGEHKQFRIITDVKPDQVKILNRAWHRLFLQPKQI